MQGLIQVLVTPSTQSSPLMIPEDLLDEASSEQSTRLRQHREELSPSTTIKAPKIDHQLETLTKVLPHVLVATPTRLWNLMQSGILDLSGIETLVLDEIDHLIRLPKRFASQREIFNRDRHPRPAELALREIMRSAEVTGRRIQDKSSVTQTSGEKGVQKQGTTDTIQIIAASATMNRPMRHWLESNGWVQDPEWVDTTKSVVLPEGIEHHCVVIGPGSVRNMRPESNHIPWNERGAQSGRQEVNALSKPQQAGEIDWIEKDQAWQNEEGKDKDASWKEQQLKAPGAVALEPEGAVERFGDDDDRMLEGVAMACMLDHVENACVFFCSSFSLSHIATRLEMDFGLSVQQIQDAFVSHSDSGATSSQAVHDRTRSDRKGKGIYLAHESNARGLDLPGLSHVYIVGLPSSPSSYVHMAGRTGRMGKKGQVVTIIRDDGHLEDRARSLFRTLNVNIQPFEHVE
ncbi:hypothetical protein BGZ54_008997 [Gamsiella multidivaricata]|nr:hypothetical protein BGZ54_008997 [Gamsiella multidivaricata]